jgi:hypothetical protein
LLLNLLGLLDLFDVLELVLFVPTPEMPFH